MKHFIKSLPLTLILCIFPLLASANTTGHAWSESVGWFDFSNVIVTNTALTGYAYNDNTGWLSFATGTTVTNTDGTLGGYAWSESVGWFDFSNVYIENNALKGYAYNDNTGWLNFTDTAVTTTWAPVVPQPRRSGSGGSIPKQLQTPTTTLSCTTDSTNIECLKELLSQLQAQLATLLANTPASNNNPLLNNTNPLFTRDLYADMDGEDVKQLQILLNSKGFIINTAPNPGAPGYESTYFGNKTQEALIKFQQANGIVPVLGFFGPLTRGKITQ